jgi:CRISPR-associated protein Csm1
MNKNYKIALAGLLKEVDRFSDKLNQNANVRFSEDVKDLLPGAFDSIDIEDVDKDILQKAYDLISEQDDPKELGLLRTIFEDISFKEEASPKHSAYHKLEALSFSNLENIIFPIENQEDIKHLKENGYKRLYDQFKKEFQNIKYFKQEQAFNFIYYLIQKYFWCVPAYSSSQDISLFDNARILSSIALCLYDFNKNNIENQNAGDKAFIIYEAQINGIQRFLYKVSKADVENENFSLPKALRGRSFFISILPELLSRYLLEKLQYPITNILYVGGGNLQLILPNINKVKDTLKEFKKDLSEYLHEEFHLDLTITDGYVELSQEDLKDNKLKDKILELQIELDEDKKRKAKDILTKDFENDKHEVCKSCKSLPVKKGDLCKWCESFSDLGANLVRSQKIFIAYLFDNDVNKTPDIKFGKFGKVYLLSDKNQEITQKAKEIIALNSATFAENGYSNGFKFIANLVPLLTNKVKNILEDILKSKETSKEVLEELKNQHQNSILSLSYLAELSKGDKKLGVFRGDVDNLGLIFSDGIRDYAIARIATLSRMLDLFFSAYISKLIMKLSKAYSKAQFGEEIDTLIYTVYSGGDDLFVIGPYNLILDFVIELRKDFYIYTAKNPDLGISGGIAIVGSKVSVELMAKLSEELESKSKSSVFKAKDNKFYLKDAVSLFGKSFKYSPVASGYNSYSQRVIEEIGPEDLDEIKKKYINYVNLEGIISLADKLASFIEDGKISRSVAHRMLSLYRLYVSEDEDVSEDKKPVTNPVIYPKIYYQIGRNVKDEAVRKSIEHWFLKSGYEHNGDLIQKEDVIRNLGVILLIALMKTRGGKKHG